MKSNWTYKTIVTPELIREYVNGCHILGGDDNEIAQAAKEYVIARKIELAELFEKFYGNQVWIMGKMNDDVATSLESFVAGAEWAINLIERELPQIMRTTPERIS